MEQLLITPHVQICAMSIYAVMIAITLGIFAVGIIKKGADFGKNGAPASSSKRTKPRFCELPIIQGADLSNFRQRIKSFWLIIILFTLAFAVNKIVAFLFIMFISYLALKEYFSLISTRRVDRRVLLWAYLAIPLQFYFIYIGWFAMFYLFVPLYMFMLIPMRMVTIGENEGFLKACGTMHWGLMTAVYALGYLALYLVLPVAKNPNGGGIGILLCILIITIFNDFMQYVFGKSFGKYKIIPKVSPNKTWEGFIGGVLSTTILTAFLAPYLTPLTIKQSIFAGFVLSIAGFLGDVIMSAIKRDIGVKDTGTLLPGHGGILDRLDSLIFTAPLFFHYCAYLHYAGAI